MKYFLAGSAGMLGNDIYKILSKCANCFVGDINTSDQHVKYLDFRHKDKYENLVDRFSPDILFHVGAHTNLEFCESNAYDCFSTNTSSVEYAVEIANKRKIKLVYISTAGIFDGKKDFYDEYDIPNPLGNYARSKFHGERFLELHSDNYLIVRAGWMMGGGIKRDKKFVGKILRLIQKGVREINIVNDKLGTPTYTKDFALNLKFLVDRDAFGKFNMVCSGLTSRLEVAQFICDYLRKNKNIDVQINEVDSDYFSKEYFSPRPENERLINRRLDNLGLNKMRPWQEALEEYLHETI